MTLTQTPVHNDELMALIDGVLDPDRARQIEQLAQHDHELAATIATLRAQHRALHASLDPVLDESIPARVLTQAPSRFSLQRVAAAMVWVAVGVTIGSLSSWQYLARHDSATTLSQRGTSPDLPRFAHQAALAHAVFAPEVKHPVEVGSIDEQGLNTWLSKRLQRTLQAPDLSRLGFLLMGGRLLPAETNRPAAQFMYEDRQGQRITVYLRSLAEATPETAFRFAEQGAVSTFYWVEGNWGYALTGELSRAQLLQIAHAIHDRLSERTPYKVSITDRSSDSVKNQAAEFQATIFSAPVKRI